VIGNVVIIIIIIIEIVVNVMTAAAAAAAAVAPTIFFLFLFFLQQGWGNHHGHFGDGRTGLGGLPTERGLGGFGGGGRNDVETAARELLFQETLFGKR